MLACACATHFSENAQIGIFFPTISLLSSFLKEEGKIELNKYRAQYFNPQTTPTNACLLQLPSAPICVCLVLLSEPLSQAAICNGHSSHIRVCSHQFVYSQNHSCMKCHLSVCKARTAVYQDLSQLFRSFT